MDRASQALAQGLPTSVPKSYRALADRSNVPCSTLHARARGQQSFEAKAQSQQYLTPFEEKAMVDFIVQMSALGTPVRIKYIPSIALSVARGRSEPNRPLKPPGKNWAKSLENRHPELKAKKVKALDWDRHEKNIFPKIAYWFEVIGEVLRNPEITKENVYNMDETGVMLSKLGSVKVLVAANDSRDYRGARVNRKMVTAVECISADGRYLKPMVIWPASTHRANWTTFPTPGWHYAFSDSGYTDTTLSLEWLKRVFDPQTSELANGKPRVLICDGFGTHEKLEILEHCFANRIILCRLPSHTSHKLQPCDIAVFAPLKTAYRDNAERLERGGVNTVGKQHFTSLYSPARETAFTKRNILAGWSKGGLFPFNPQRVLQDMEEPYARLMEAAGGSVTSQAQVMAPPLPPPATSNVTTPVTPVTPVSAEAFTSLQHTIIKETAKTLDEVQKRRLVRHLGKLAKAGQILLAKSTLQEGHIRFLHKINDEGKARRSTRAIVLGTAKVMSYEDLEEAKAKRAGQAEKSKNVKEKQKGGRKRKDGSPKACKSSANSGARRASDSAGMISDESQTTGPRDVVDGPTAPCPGRAPVARMW